MGSGACYVLVKKKVLRKHTHTDTEHMWHALIVATAFGQSTTLECAAIRSLFTSVQLVTGEQGCCGHPDGRFAADTCTASKLDVSGGLDPALETAMDTFLQNGTLLQHLPTSIREDAHTSLPFVSVSVRRGVDVFEKTYGVNPNGGPGTALPLASDFEAITPYYSSTKLVTNMMGLKFVDLGILDLDAPVHYYVPEFHSDRDVANEASILPLSVLRPVSSCEESSHCTKNDGTQTVEVNGVTVDIKTHTFSSYMGSLQGTAVQYFDEPLSPWEYPTLRQFMTHMSGASGLNAYAQTFVNQEAVTTNYAAHAIVTDMEMQHCQSRYIDGSLTSAAEWYGVFYLCGEPTQRSLRVSFEAFVSVGRLIFRPGTTSHYSHSGGFVGRLVEVAYAMHNHSASLDASFGDITKELLFDPVGLRHTAFYAPEGSDLSAYFGTNFLKGTVPSDSVTDDGYGWRVDNNWLRTNWFSVRGAACDLSMYSSATEFLKLMHILKDGRARNGYRFLRAPTARLLTTYAANSITNWDEVSRSGGAPYQTVGTWTLGGAMQPISTYGHDHRDFRNEMGFESYGHDSVQWGGAAGTSWFYNAEDDLAFSFQVNVRNTVTDYLRFGLAALIQDHLL